MQKNKTTAYIMAYLVLVLAVWLAFSFSPAPKITVIDRQTGILDLSTADFTDTVYYYLDNFWENYPACFYTPADFAGETPPVRQPMSYDDFRRVQFATHRMRLSLPPGETYGLYMKSADYAMRIFIDGKEVDCVGLPTDRAETNIPRVAERTYYFVPEGEVTSILVQSSNWVHKEGAYHPNIYIGAPGDIETLNRHNLLITAVITGCLLTSFLYYLGIFLLNRSRLPTLLFSLCCLLLALLIGNLLPILFPAYNWFVVIRLQYMVRFLTFAGLVRFLDTLFPRLLHRPVTRPYYALAAAYTLFTLLAPPNLSSRALIGFDVCSVPMIGYVLVRLAMQLPARKLQNTLAFLGTLLVCLFGINDILYHNNVYLVGTIGGQLFSTPIGMTFFVFCYGLVLSLEQAETERAMIAARESEQRLTTENAALDRVNRMRSDLTTTVSHEMRTPLAVMSVYAQLSVEAIREGRFDAQTTANLEMISAEALRLADLATDLLRLSIVQEDDASRALFDLGAVLRQTARLCEPMLKKGGNALTLSVADDLPEVVGNAGELTQVLWNLLSNAAAHTKDGAVVVTAERSGDQIAATVRDTGEGIAPELLPHVFERRRGDGGGTGVGLAVCREIIEAHGGRITAESGPGRGTAITFTMPIQEEAI